jgi:2-polyprenyl-6-methoxyphenol hydroxylase-like FAD-dependent oxidoreductase
LPRWFDATAEHLERTMANFADQAVVIGAGMGGLAAAGALSDFFSRVIVLDRDTLPSEGVARSGVPQGAHTHGLLVGGLRALEKLFRGVEQGFIAAGAVAIDAARDVRVERPGFDPFPARMLGIPFYCLSRPVIEFSVRQRVEKLANVELRAGCRVEELVPTPDGRAVQGVRYSTSGGGNDTLTADLVIDASGRGVPTLDFLNATARHAPPEAVIGMSMNYVTAHFAVPGDAPDDWKGVYLLPKAPDTSRGALLLPIEHGRWTVTMFAGHDDRPPNDDAGFHAFAQGLRVPTVANALKSAKRVTPFSRFRFPGSSWRHFENVDDFPRGLLPLGDAACRFNPVFGQGMSVAAQEAVLLRRLLAGAEGDLTDLADAYFSELPKMLDAPWATAALDLAYPQTQGERPPDFERQMKFGAALMVLAARDADIHSLVLEVTHLIKPRRVYREPALQERVRAVLAEMALSTVN